MRIFHVSDCYAPRTGGIESQVRDLARAQVARGHEVHVLTATPAAGSAPGRDVQDDDGVQVHRLGTRMPFDLPVNPAAPPRVRALLRELAPDVVHVHAGVVSPFAFDGARVALDAGTPLAITWHCMLDGAVPALRAGVRRTAWRDAPVALSAVSGAAAERVAEVFGAPVEVMPNGMDLAGWAPAPATDGAASPDPTGRGLRCVATMRLAPRKRGPALVGVIEDAMTQLPPGALDVEVLGDGPARATMQRRIRRRDLTGVVTLRGRLPRAEVREVYRRAEVFLAPAVLEAFGIAALEARAAGLVVVARRGTGIEEFVTHDVDGLIVDDDAGMARAVVRLAVDRDLLARLREAARSVPPAFDWARAVATAESEYRRARVLRDAGA
ncbi:glycosyltransferase family 4 protein [Actinotalea sp. K2]|uniref:glycosyltransferase family 4 protein n=1 Tax=Actinotalea sp. K2 TaxID=2939438 RepID=UPI0020177A90|nr:glycosyltransferase family 4 protein [Actinotalea sp. K2]MCL3859919.1 glycosyltransferase family 4 protein [Actinotalea sp. K2]